MKKKDIYEVTLKIIGIIAMYKFIESLIGSAIAFVIFHAISTNIKLDFIGGVTQTNFSIYFVLITVLYGVIGYLFLFKTDKLLSLFRLTESTEATLQIEKKTIYHITVLLIGFFMLTFSGNQLTSSTYYQSEVSTTKQTTTGQPTISQNATGEKNTAVISTSTVTSPRTSTTVNYTNIILLLLSILIILKSEKLSSILMPKEKTELID
jgi:hypothetical protein